VCSGGSRSGNRKTPKIPTLAKSMASIDPPLVRLRTMRIGSSGNLALVSNQAKTEQDHTEGQKTDGVVVGPRGRIGVGEAVDQGEEPPVTMKSPGKSSGSWSVPLSFSSQSRAPTVATTAKIRLTKRCTATTRRR